MKNFQEIMEIIGITLDGIGVAVIIAGAAIAAGHVIAGRRDLSLAVYKSFRQSLGRAILLGLEFLIAGDIIRTVVVSPTFENVVVLGIIVLIRIFLSMSLEVELGNVPWKKDRNAGG